MPTREFTSKNVVPFATKAKLAFQPLTDERVHRIAGLANALQHEFAKAEADLKRGAPYLGTPLRLGELPDLSGLIIEATSEDLLRAANPRSRQASSRNPGEAC